MGTRMSCFEECINEDGSSLEGCISKCAITTTTEGSEPKKMGRLQKFEMDILTADQKRKFEEMFAIGEDDKQDVNFQAWLLYKKEDMKEEEKQDRKKGGKIGGKRGRKKGRRLGRKQINIKC